MRWNYRVGPVEITECSTSRLVVQDHAQEATMDRRQPAVVIDKAKLLELIHEMIDPRPTLRYKKCGSSCQPSRGWQRPLDRKSTRLNSSHGYISYAVFCLKKKKKKLKRVR